MLIRITKQTNGKKEIINQMKKNMSELIIYQEWRIGHISDETRYAISW